MTRPPRVASPLALIALALAACGGTAVPSPTASLSSATAVATATATATSTATSPDEPSVSPSTAPASGATGATSDVIDAAAATLAEGTVRVDQTIEFRESKVIPDGTSATTVGQATFGQPRQMRLEADLTELGQGPIEMIVDDNLLYMRGTVFEQLAGEGKWLLVDLESDSPAAAPFKGLATGQNDVGIAIIYLYGLTDATDTGDEEDVRGVPTRRYEGTADLEAARDSVPAEYAEPFEDAIAALRVGGVAREVTTEAWIGDDGLVHRVRYVYTLGPTQGGGELETVIDFRDFGARVELDLPGDEDVVNIEDAVPAPT